MPFEHLSCSDLKEWFATEKQVHVLDIRDVQSYQSGHIEGATHIHNDNVQQFIADNDKSIPVVVCCYHGNSSQGAADFFNQQGYSKCYSLDGGYEAWKNTNS